MARLNKEFLRAFIEGTLKTLNIQCDTKVSAGKPFLKGTKPQPEFALAGIIGITSNEFNGTINLAFTEKVFLGLMNKMLAEEFTVITEDLTSGASELLNIIFGSAKAVLNKQGHSIKMAIPTVVRGQGLNTTQLTLGPILVLPFRVEQGEFFIEISSQSNWSLDGAPAT